MIKCPNCGKSYYQVKYSITTAVYYPPIYKDGININPDRNSETVYCDCLNCIHFHMKIILIEKILKKQF